jgi:hypothetical protein
MDDGVEIENFSDEGHVKARFTNVQEAFNFFYALNNVPNNAQARIDFLRREMPGQSEHFSGPQECYLEALELSFLAELLGPSPRLSSRTIATCLELFLSEHSPSP